MYSRVSHWGSRCCLQVCYYRDKQSINKFRIITATKAGVKLTEPFALETNWHYKVRNGYDSPQQLARRCEQGNC